MKSFNALFIILTLALAVSCGGDKKSKSSGLSSNPYQVSTVNAYYTPAKPQQIYYGSRWYQLQPFSQNAPMELQNLYGVTSQAISTASTQYRLHLINNIPMFTVRVVGSLGGGMTQQYPGQYQQPVQQVNSGVFSLQSIQLVR
jgi:hypothetical protein